MSRDNLSGLGSNGTGLTRSQQQQKSDLFAASPLGLAAWRSMGGDLYSGGADWGTRWGRKGIAEGGGTFYGDAASEAPAFMDAASIAAPTAQQDGAHYPAQPLATVPTASSRTSLFWGELEAWMDDEYARQVCAFMRWEPIQIKVPRPAPDPATGTQANNPGYLFLTFATPQQAAAVLQQINSPPDGKQVMMPNSNKPFILNWASSTPITPTVSPPAQSTPITTNANGNGNSSGTAGNKEGNGSDKNGSGGQQSFPKEYSIFVGDLAPEASNSDLVAVFRNPVLGLRNDREPKFIRPFLSCKSAKIMLDPVTGVSRGYGFVRFTDEADQQRALIEMHGLYCLSRPMRISPATAKFKPQQAPDLPQVQNPPPPSALGSGLPALPPYPPPQSASPVSPAPINSHQPDDLQSVLSQIAAIANSSTPAPKPAPPAPHNSITASFASTPGAMSPNPGEGQEGWKHQTQVRAILSSLIGPNGEQLTSTDPYNTTVFVGGLSPLIAEDTLRTFFAPFGDIHYVKVPAGKHCGFVQFVRKADAERAIDRMQGFPIGGSRIRLSWGRSQYKAAQAAAQAAQAAAMQLHTPPAPVASTPVPQVPAGLSAEQALEVLRQLGLAGLLTKDAQGQGSEMQLQALLEQQGLTQPPPPQTGHARRESALAGGPRNFAPGQSYDQGPGQGGYNKPPPVRGGGGGSYGGGYNTPAFTGAGANANAGAGGYSNAGGYGMQGGYQAPFGAQQPGFGQQAYAPPPNTYGGPSQAPTQSREYGPAYQQHQAQASYGPAATQGAYGQGSAQNYGSGSGQQQQQPSPSSGNANPYSSNPNANGYSSNNANGYPSNSNANGYSSNVNNYSSASGAHQERERAARDEMHDLNGTLASLDLGGAERDA
ncbi:RNA-binding domain-containing protein [Peniophora sp. CONT]|nr:RNA-binding domain-containing protein [Peniophora sp. CONT]